MSDEKLKLEISLEIQQALQNAKAMGAAMAKLVTDTERVAPPSKEVAREMTALGRNMQNAILTAQALGDSTGGLAARSQLLASSIRNLIESGVSPNSEEVKSLSKEYQSLDKELNSTMSATDGLGGAFSQLTETALVMGAALAAKELLGGAALEFAEAEASAKRLGMAMAMKGNEEGVARIAAYSEQIQKLTGASGDMIQQLAAEMTMQGKSEAQIQKIITAAADLSAVTGDDLKTSIDALNGSLSGQSRELGKTIPAIKDMTEEQMRSGAAIDLVAKMYAGSADKMQNTSAVAYARMSEAVGDLAEGIGQVLAPAMVAGANVITALAEAGTFVTQVFVSLPGPIQVLVGGMATLTIAAVAYTTIQKMALMMTLAENAQKAIAILREGALTAAKWLAVAVARAVALAQGLANSAQAVSIGQSITALALSIRNRVAEMASAVAMGVKTAAQWLATVAQISYNAAMIVTLSLTGVGIALVVAAVAASAAYVASLGDQEKAQAGANSAAEEGNEANQKLAEAYKNVEDAMKSSRVALDDMNMRGGLGFMTGDDVLSKKIDIARQNIAKFQDYIVALKVQIDTADPSMKGFSSRINDWKIRMADAEVSLQGYTDQLKALDAEQKASTATKERIEREKKALLDAIEALKAYRAAWDAAMAKNKAQDDVQLGKQDLKVNDLDTAGVNFEWSTKIAEFRAMVAAAGQTMTGMNNQVLYEMYRSWVDAENEVKAVEMDRILQVHYKEAQEIDAKKNAEIARIAEVTQKQAEARAQLTATKIDDLEIERTRALANAEVLFKDSADKEAILAQIKKNYDAEISKARLDEVKAKWAAERQAAQDQFDYEKELARRGQGGDYASFAAESAVGGTQLGQTVGMGGNISVDPVTQLIDAFVDMLAKIENLNKVMNWASTIMEGALAIIEGPVNEALQPVVDALMKIGTAIGKILLPVIDVVSNVLSTLMGVLDPVINMLSAILPIITQIESVLYVMNPGFLILSTVLKLVSAAFQWFYDAVIVPVGNAIIDVVNTIIRAINSLSFITGITIDEMERLRTTAEQENLTNEIDAKKTRINELLDDVTQYYQEQRDALKELTSQSINSWQDLLKVGAISESMYADKVSGLNSGLESGLKNLDISEAAMAKNLNDILGQLEDGINVDITNIDAMISALTGNAASTVDYGKTPSSGTDTGLRGVLPDTGRSNPVGLLTSVVPNAFNGSSNSQGVGIARSMMSSGNTTVNNYYSTNVEGSVIRERDMASFSADAARAGRSSGRIGVSSK